MNLIEREAELTALGTLFAEALAGHGRVVIIGGGVAAGKTALMRTFAEDATRSGAVFRYVAATRTEQQVPLGVVRQLFDDSEQLSTAPENVLRLLDRGTRTAVFGTTGQQPEMTTDATGSTFPELCRILLDRARRTPLVIGIDDVHHADTASLLFLRYLAHRLKSARILLILTERTGPRQRDPLFHADLLSLRHCRRIRLRLLSPDAQARLLATRLDERTCRRGTATCHAVTGGNPLLVHALLKDNRGAPPDITDLAVDTAFAQAVAGCFQRGGPDMTRVAQALSILPAPAAPDLIGGLLDLDTGYVAEVIDAMNAAGLLDAGRFRHPAVRLTMLDVTTPEERGALHDRAARLLHERGAEPAAVAGHLVQAGAAPPWAVPVLEEAAAQALADDEPRTALACLHLALRSSAGERDRARITSALARTEWRIDPAGVDDLLPSLVTAVRDGLLDTRHVLDLPGYLMWHGRAAEAVEVLHRLTGPAAPRTGGPARDLAATRLLMTCVYPEAMDRSATGRATVDRRLVAANAGRRLRAAAVLTAVLTGEPVYDVSGTAEQVLQGARLGASSPGSVLPALTALIYDEQWQLAARWCDPLLEEAATRRDPVWHATLAATRAVISLRQGDMVTAEEHARAALSRLSPTGWGVMIGVPISVTVLTATAMGRYEDAATHLGIAVPQAMFRTPSGLHYLQARGRFHLATGHPDSALDDFQACGELMRKWGFDIPGLVAWRTEAAQALLELGDVRRAAELAEEQLAMLRPGPGRARGVALRCLALTITDVRRRLEPLQEAVRILEQFGDRYELALALGELSRAQHAQGEHTEALASAQSAERLTERYGIRLPTPPVPLAGDETAADPAADLTEAERRVAALAAQGQTNREIADTLQITVSTVEQHLTRIYRKLGVDRRTLSRRRTRSGSADVGAAGEAAD